jgi:Putative mono-oxygenase ydhR
MKNAQSVLSVKFNSTLSADKLINVCKENLEIFKNVPGLLQKYYITEEGTGAISGIYVFETKSAREAFWNSALAKNIPAKYGVIPATLRVEQYEMAIVLNEGVLV